jgi:dihydroneopterin aldolase
MAGDGTPEATRPTGRIEVRGLRVVGTHGVLDEERARPQPFEVDLDLGVDLALAARTDRLEDTVDYGAVVEATAAVVAGPRSFALLEALAGAVGEAALATSPLLEAVTVTLRKLRPPLAADVASVGVRLTVGRQAAASGGAGGRPAAPGRTTGTP